MLGILSLSTQISPSGETSKGFEFLTCMRKCFFQNYNSYLWINFAYKNHRVGGALTPVSDTTIRAVRHAAVQMGLRRLRCYAGKLITSHDLLHSSVTFEELSLPLPQMSDAPYPYSHGFRPLPSGSPLTSQSSFMRLLHPMKLQHLFNRTCSGLRRHALRLLCHLLTSVCSSQHLMAVIAQ